MGTGFIDLFLNSGCSITVVRMHGVHVARVQFPAPRPRIRACSSSGRALHSHCRGKGFESPQVHVIYSGCGITVLRTLRVRVIRVQFPAARPIKTLFFKAFFIIARFDKTGHRHYNGI